MESHRSLVSHHRDGTQIPSRPILQFILLLFPAIFFFWVEFLFFSASLPITVGLCVFFLLLLHPPLFCPSVALRVCLLLETSSFAGGRHPGLSNKKDEQHLNPRAIFTFLPVSGFGLVQRWWRSFFTPPRRCFSHSPVSLLPCVTILCGSFRRKYTIQQRNTTAQCVREAKGSSQGWAKWTSYFHALDFTQFVTGVGSLMAWDCVQQLVPGWFDGRDFALLFISPASSSFLWLF